MDNITNNKQTRVKFSTKAIIVFLISVIILFFVVWVYQYAGYLELLKAEKTLTDQINYQTKIKERLLREKNYQKSDAYYEEIARKELDMLKPNEMKIVISLD